GLKAKPPDPIQVVLADQVQGERAARFDDLPSVVLARDADEHARQFGDQGGVAHKRGDEAALARAVLSGHEPEFAVGAVKDGGRGRGGHDGLLRDVPVVPNWQSRPTRPHSLVPADGFWSRNPPFFPVGASYNDGFTVPGIARRAVPAGAG